MNGVYETINGGWNDVYKTRNDIYNRLTEKKESWTKRRN